MKQSRQKHSAMIKDASSSVQPNEGLQLASQALGHGIVERSPAP